jgi:SAM-dependent methyltransferase
MTNFAAYSRYYDLLYKDKNYSAESAYVAKMLRNYNPDVKHILELGCGSGAHAEYLCLDGFEVTGIERSNTMVEEANKKHIAGFTPLQGDITSYRLNKKFDAAISLFHVISYLTGNESVIDCLQSTHHHLKKNGLFLFDVWYSPAVYNQKPETRIKRLEDEHYQIIRLAEPEIQADLNVVDVNYEIIIKNKKTGAIEHLKEQHPMRHFSIPEIKLFAAYTGFEVIQTEEFFTGKPTGADTWGVCFLLRKK